MTGERGTAGWLVTVIALVALGLTLSAAYWQFTRAKHKEILTEDYYNRQKSGEINLNLTDDFDLSRLRYRKVAVRGYFLPEATIFLDNRIHNNAPGYEVITPLKLNHSGRQEVEKFILINRGWIPLVEGERTTLPSVHTDTGLVLVEGVLDFPKQDVFLLGQIDHTREVWPVLDFKELKNKLNFPFEEFVIHETNRANGFRSSFKKPNFGIRTHQMYAGQWLLFSGLILCFYIYFVNRRRRNID